jgi:hypothetical protein
VEAAGIAPGDLAPQVISQHDTCVEHGCRWLHYGCNDASLQELVATWHQLTLAVRQKIIELLRGTR